MSELAELLLVISARHTGRPGTLTGLALRFLAFSFLIFNLLYKM